MGCPGATFTTKRGGVWTTWQRWQRAAPSTFIAHFSDVQCNGFKSLQEGQKISLVSGVGQKGPVAAKIAAISVSPALRNPATRGFFRRSHVWRRLRTRSHAYIGVEWGTILLFRTRTRAR
ncbi:cold shock domain-containing protein [Ralstonia sp. CHL-2022]|uniref:Cold shock domain-containing protein n=1 Tax=Ralstonia mojiangensis TaxID=2953895 RepID=A0AAE3I7U6_9RALS|nr:cold shock domain-containing protein [Ralstonia mojiangensis]MCT7312417.1 cold shock domain-containing protein [Ralstonia mojiangensis]MCT7318173.1 cold shock domain-containing protein [Ralstonia mojiangensis]MCT7327069.1 cold shock domain-containing protein [Ralstonia mojiangensis]